MKHLKRNKDEIFFFKYIILSLQDSLEQYKTEVFEGLNNIALVKEFEDVPFVDLINDYISKEIFAKF